MNAHNLMNQICATIAEKERRLAAEALQLKQQEQQQNQSGQGQDPSAPAAASGRKYYTPPPTRLPTPILCRNEILKTCGLDVLVLIEETPKITRQYKTSLAKLRSYNISNCLKENYGFDFHTVGLPRRFKDPEEHLYPSKLHHHHQRNLLPAALIATTVAQAFPQRKLHCNNNNNNVLLLLTAQGATDSLA